MYSKEERMKAIELYIKYDKCAADVVNDFHSSFLLPVVELQQPFEVLSTCKKRIK